MHTSVTIRNCIDDGLENLKENFWAFILIVIILGIFDAIGNGNAVQQGMENQRVFEGGAASGFLVFFISFFIKPVFDFGANLQFVKGNRNEDVEVRDIACGFSSKELYIDIILTNLMVMVLIILGFVCLILPGIYVLCRLVLSSYLVIDKGLAPKQAVSASWVLMRDDWAKVILLGLVSVAMCIIGVLLLFVGIFPTIVWIKSMFASFYQQIIDSHDENFLLSLDIEP
jgi:hypothetical protein